MKNVEDVKRLTEVVPHRRQIALQQTEFYAFFHFGISTYTDREWGTGKEPPALFYPEKMDALSWVKAIKKAGMKGALLTCKHHDGFCLWPSKYTSHTVAFSPYKNGKGDIVKEVSDACKAEGIKFGVYLSPWDLNNPAYGKGEEYNEYFVNQLTELLTGYGEIFEVWFDGACGEGANGKVQTYDWERYYEVIRRLQPEACISVCGPDVRWCGNEGGHTRKAEWSVVPERLSRAEIVKALSQQEDSEEFRTRKINSKDEDLGSRQALSGEEALIWYPSEVDVSIRPGWFYHSAEDDKLRSLEELLHIYYSSVGGNSTLLLNIPPTPEGLLAEPDVKLLQEIGNYLENTFADNLAENAAFYWDLGQGEYQINYEDAKGEGRFFATQEGTSQGTLLLRWEKPVTFSHVVLKEYIPMSQRVESYEILAETDTGLRTVASGETIGYKKILRFEPVTAEAVRICIKESRVSIALEFVGVYG